MKLKKERWHLWSNVKKKKFILFPLEGFWSNLYLISSTFYCHFPSSVFRAPRPSVNPPPLPNTQTLKYLCHDLKSLELRLLDKKRPPGAHKSFDPLTPSILSSDGSIKAYRVPFRISHHFKINFLQYRH